VVAVVQLVMKVVLKLEMEALVVRLRVVQDHAVSVA